MSNQHTVISQEAANQLLNTMVQSLGITGLKRVRVRHGLKDKGKHLNTIGSDDEIVSGLLFLMEEQAKELRKLRGKKNRPMIGIEAMDTHLFGELTRKSKEHGLSQDELARVVLEQWLERSVSQREKSC